MLRRERYDGGGTAMGGRAGRGLEGIRVQEPGTGDLLDMAMGIDAAGQDKTAGRIDIVSAARFESFRQFDDPPVLDRDVHRRDPC